MDKLDELAREAAEHLLRYLKDDEVKIKLVGGIVDDWFPYLRRAYEMGENDILKHADSHYWDTLSEHKSLIMMHLSAIRYFYPVEPVEKPKLSAAEIAKLKEEITASNEQTKKDSRVDTDTWKMEFSSQLAEPVEKPQNMSGTDMRINLEIREREIAVKDEEIKELKEEMSDLQNELNEIMSQD